MTSDEHVPTLGDVAADLVESFAELMARKPNAGRGLDEVLMRACLRPKPLGRFVDLPRS